VIEFGYQLSILYKELFAIPLCAEVFFNWECMSLCAEAFLIGSVCSSDWDRALRAVPLELCAVFWLALCAVFWLALSAHIMSFLLSMYVDPVILRQGSPRACLRCGTLLISSDACLTELV